MKDLNGFTKLIKIHETSPHFTVVNLTDPTRDIFLESHLTIYYHKLHIYYIYIDNVYIYYIHIYIYTLYIYIMIYHPYIQNFAPDFLA